MTPCPGYHRDCACTSGVYQALSSLHRAWEWGYSHTEGTCTKIQVRIVLLELLLCWLSVWWWCGLRIVAERLSVRHLILLRSRIAFVCMYVCMSVTHFNYCVGHIRFTWAVQSRYTLLASYSSLAQGHVFWWRWSLNWSNLSLKAVLLDYEKDSKGPLPPKRAKLKSGKLTEKGRNSVDSRNLASTSRAVFQMTKSSKLCELRTLRIPSTCAHAVLKRMFAISAIDHNYVNNYCWVGIFQLVIWKRAPCKKGSHVIWQRSSELHVHVQCTMYIHVYLPWHSAPWQVGCLL